MMSSLVYLGIRSRAQIVPSSLANRASAREIPAVPWIARLRAVLAEHAMCQPRSVLNTASDAGRPSRFCGPHIYRSCSMCATVY